MTSSNPGETFDIGEVLKVVARHKYLILTFCVSAALTSLALTYVLSEKYVASTTMLYQPNQAVSFRPKDREALGFPTPLVSLESIGNTLDEFAKSDGLIEQVVRSLNLDVKRPRPPASWLMTTFHETKDTIKEYGGKAWQIMRYGRILDKDPFGQAMADLRKNLTIRRTAKAYTFRLEVVDNSPEMAALIVDEVAAVLSSRIEEQQRREATETRENLDKRLAENQAEIAVLRGQLDTFKKDSRVASLAEELSLKLKTVAGFQEEHARARNDLQALQMKRSEQQQQLSLQEQSVRYDSTTTRNPVVEEMQLELAKLEVERSGLLGRFTEQHQEVRSVDARIAQVRRKLDGESAKVVSSESIRANDIYQKLLSDRLATDAEIEAVNARLAAYDDSIGQETALTRNLTSKEQRFADLSLRLAGAERSFALVSEAHEEARIAESRAAGQLSILHKALVPRAPARPIKILHVGASFALSLILGVGLTFLFNFFDTSVRRIDQVERLLNVPVLGTIPAVPTKGRERLLFGNRAL